MDGVAAERDSRPRDLLEHDGVVDEAGFAAATELLGGDLDAEDAEFTETLEEFARRMAGLVPFLPVRRDFAFDEVAHHLPELLVLFGENRALHVLVLVECGSGCRGVTRR